MTEVRKPLIVNITGEPDDIERFLQMITPSGPTEFDEQIANKLWGKRKSKQEILGRVKAR
jgi:hypothetical protein